MHFGARKQADPGAVPLQNAVVCVDCAAVTDSRLEECPLCGSRALLSVSSVLGNTLPLHKIERADKNVERFDLEFTIDLKQMELKDLNAAIQHITGLIGPRLVRGRAHCHISVEPVADRREGDEEVA